MSNTASGAIAGSAFGPVGTAIGTGVGMVSDLALNWINNRNQTKMYNHQLKWQEGQSALQRQWSSNEAEKARAFDTAEREAQQAWQEKITDPGYQLGRWLNAGLNPANFNGDTSPNGVPSGSSVGLPSGVAASPGSMPNLTPYRIDLAQTRLMNAQAESIEDDNKRKNEMHEYDIKAAGVNISLAEDELENIRPAQLRKLKEEVNLVSKNIEKTASEIDVNKASERLLNAQGYLEQKKVDSYAQELQAFLDKNASEIRVNDANVKLMAQNVAESVARIQKMEKEGQLIDAQVKGQIIQNGLSGIEFEVQQAGKSMRMILDYDSAVNQIRVNAANADAAESEAAVNRYQKELSEWKDYWKVPKFIEHLVSCLGYPLGAGVNFSKQLK